MPLVLIIEIDQMSIHKDYDELAYLASREGRVLDLVDWFSRGTRDVTYAAMGAAESGHLTIISLLDGSKIREFEASYPTVIAGLRAGKTMSQLALDPNCQDELAKIRCRSLVEAAVKLDRVLAGRYTTDYQDIVGEAARRGRTDLIDLYQTKIHDLNVVAYQAALGGYTELVKTLIDRGATDLNYIAEAAVRMRYLPLLNYLIERGATNIDQLIEIGRSEDRLDVIQALINLPRPDIQPKIDLGNQTIIDLPTEVVREYIAPYLSDRDQIRLEPYLEGVRLYHQDRLTKFPTSRLIRYIDLFPLCQVAHQVLLSRPSEVVYQTMLDHDSPLIISYYPDRIDRTFQEAYRARRSRIVTRLIAKYGKDRFHEYIN